MPEEALGAVSITVSVSKVGPNVTVGVPETTQVLPLGVTISPAGNAGANMQLVSGAFPPVVMMVCE
jgi:hypothetical protein